METGEELVNGILHPIQVRPHVFYHQEEIVKS